MSGPDNDRFEMTDPGFDPEAALWVRGVDYLGGWRQAREAAEALTDALDAAGVETGSLRATAQTQADGAGVVRLLWPAETVQQVAELVRRGALRKAG